jgi:hypothetical protein
MRWMRGALVLMMLLVPAVVSSASAETPVGCGPFRVEWDRTALSPGSENLEGFVYNESSCSVSDVRIHVVAVDAEGHPLAETMGWVFGDIPAGGCGYFAIPLTKAAAAGYHVNVVSFDELSPRGR